MTNSYSQKLNNDYDEVIVVDGEYKDLNVEGRTLLNLASVQNDSEANFYVVGEELNGQSIEIEQENFDYSVPRNLKDVILEGSTYISKTASLINSMDNVSMQKLNEGYDDVNVVDGEFKNAILKGQTLVNIVPSVTPLISAYVHDWYQINENSLNKIDVTIVTPPTSWKYVRFPSFGEVDTLNKIKPNTKYLIKFDELQNIAYIGIQTGDGAITVAPFAEVNGNYAIVTTNNTWEIVDYILLYLLPNNDLQPNDRIICKNPIMVEYQEGMENWDISYFEGVQSVKMPVLTTTGKNLFDGELELGSINTKGNPNDSDNCLRSVNFIKINPSTPYIITNDLGYTIALYEYDSNFNFIKNT